MIRKKIPASAEMNKYFEDGRLKLTGRCFHVHLLFSECPITISRRIMYYTDRCLLKCSHMVEESDGNNIKAMAGI